MFSRCLTFLSATFGLLVLSAMPALATVFTANATTTCSTYSLALTASDLTPGAQYTIAYTVNVSPGSNGLPLTGSIPFIVPDSGTFTNTVTGSFPALAGSFTFSGTAILTAAISKGEPFATNINFSPTSLTCGLPPPPPCSARSFNDSNFNGTPVNAGDYVWFNANFTATGIPSSGAKVTLTDSTISFLEGGTQHQLAVPNAQIVFSPGATCSSTTFDTMTNTWTTTVPVQGDDEIFLSGLACAHWRTDRRHQSRKLGRHLQHKRHSRRIHSVEVGCGRLLHLHNQLQRSCRQIGSPDCLRTKKWRPCRNA